MKKLALLLLSVLLIPWAWARADSNPSNDSTALMIRITPNFDLGVLIDTGSVNLDLGNVAMGASTQTVSPATITVTSNFINTELNLAASISGGWVFDPNQTYESTGTNQLNAWASFTSLSTAAAPSQDGEYFRVGASSGSKIISNTNIFGPAAVGINGSSGVGRFESNASGSADMDSMTPNARRHLWLYFKTPSMSSVTADQDIQFQFSVRLGP